MIAGIDRQLDISIYFQKNEIESLSKGEQVAGILIRTEKPNEQGNITTQVNNIRENLNGFGIGIDDKNYWGVDKNFKLDVFIGNYYFNLLQNRDRIGTRHSLRDGSQVILYSNLDDFNTRNMMDNLEFYRDNK